MRKLICFLSLLLLLLTSCGRKITENLEEVGAGLLETMEEIPDSNTEEQRGEGVSEEEIPPFIFEWEPIETSFLMNLSFDYKACESISLRTCPAQELINRYYWVNYKQNGITDADAFLLSGQGFEVLIVADTIQEPIDTLEFANDYVYYLITSTGKDNIRIPPEQREMGNQIWTYFATSSPNPSKLGDYLNMEQFALCQFKNELYSIHVKIFEVSQNVFEEVQTILSSLQILSYQDRVNTQLRKIQEIPTPEFITTYDRSLLTGSDIYTTLKKYQRTPLAVIVKTKQNRVTSVANYNTLLGIKRNERFDLTKLEIIGTPPDAEKLKTTDSIELFLANWNIEEALLKLSDDYIDPLSKFLSFLIYDERDLVVGIYFEQLRKD